jgi:putative ABC transport system permease protein
LGLAQRFVLGALRTIVQLVLVGYVLVYIFAFERWYLVVATLCIMLMIATKAAVNRQHASSQKLLMITGVAMLVASGLTLLYISTLVVRVVPWYNPQYLIPLFGMIVGSTMNAAAIAAERLHSEVTARQAEIEAYLALGASYQQATQQPVRQALRASLIPTKWSFTKVFGLCRRLRYTLAAQSSTLNRNRTRPFRKVCRPRGKKAHAPLTLQRHFL